MPPPPPTFGGGLSNLSVVPSEFRLNQNYPNPFNPQTEIRYDLPEDARVTLKIYDVLGREITILVDRIEGAGYKTAHWNGSGFTSGVYFYRIDAVSVSNPGRVIHQVEKMVLIK